MSLGWLFLGELLSSIARLRFTSQASSENRRSSWGRKSIERKCASSKLSQPRGSPRSLCYSARTGAALWLFQRTPNNSKKVQLEYILSEYIYNRMLLLRETLQRFMAGMDLFGYRHSTGWVLDGTVDGT